MRLLLFCKACFRWTVLFAPDRDALPTYILAVHFLQVHARKIDGWDSTVIVADDSNDLLLRTEAREVFGDHERCSFADALPDSILHVYCKRCLLCKSCGKCSHQKETR